MRLGKSSSIWGTVGTDFTCRRIDTVEIDSTDLHLIRIVVNIVALLRTAVGVTVVASLDQIVVCLGRDYRMG